MELSNYEVTVKLQELDERLTGLSDRVSVQSLGDQLNANFYNHFPKMLLLRDDLEKLKKFCETIGKRLEKGASLSGTPNKEVEGKKLKKEAAAGGGATTMEES
jgi:hypothetical protein